MASGVQAEVILQRLQEDLSALQLHQAASGPGLGGLGITDALAEMRLPAPPKGSGPRIFCGHVPKEVTEDLVKAHFSRWGLVTDVYFPRHKKTLKRRPFCFVTFATKDSADRALTESPLNICGIPIKNLTMVEDRDKYYKEKHAAARQALMAALASLGAAGKVPQEQVNNIAALLAMEGISPEAVLAALLQQHGIGGPTTAPASGMHQPQPPQQQQQQLLPTFAQQTSFAAPHSQAAALPPNLSLPSQQLGALYHSNGAASSSARPPLPLSHGAVGINTPHPVATTPFAAMMSREGSHGSSLSSASDWLSVGPSSARNSLDASQFFQGHGQSSISQLGPAPPGARVPSDNAMRLRQQLQALAANASAAGGSTSVLGLHGQNQGLPWQLAGATQAQGGLQHGPSQINGPAAALQSSFYQPVAAPVQQMNNHHSPTTFSLPPIREGNSVDATELGKPVRGVNSAPASARLGSPLASVERHNSGPGSLTQSPAFSVRSCSNHEDARNGSGGSETLLNEMDFATGLPISDPLPPLTRSSQH